MPLFKEKSKKIINYLTMSFAFLFSFFIFSNASNVNASSNSIIRVSQNTDVKEYTGSLYVYEITYKYKFMGNFSDPYTASLKYTLNGSFENISLIPRDVKGDSTGGYYLNYVYYIQGNESSFTAEEMYEKSGKQFSNVATNSAFFSGEDTVSGTAINIESVVFDNTEPSIVQDGWSGAYVTNVNTPISVDTLKTMLRAYDETDGNVEIYVVSDNYSANKNIVGGPYNVVYGAKDASENEATITIQVYVVDTTAPVISGTNSYISNMSSPISLETIKGNLSVSDNYDTGLTINLVEDNWSANKDKKGTYSIIYNATDSSGNVSSNFIVSVQNKDDIKPVITGTNEYNVSNTTEIAIDTIISDLTATDNVDGKISISIASIQSNEYTENKYTVGSYDIVFVVADSSNNFSDEFVVTVNVFDNIAPVFYVSGNFVAVDADTVLTREQLIQIIAQMNNIETTALSNVTCSYDTYTKNATKVGTYRVILSYNYNNGSVINVDTDIKVVRDGLILNENVNSDKEENKNEGKEEVEEKVDNWFKKLCNEIKNFFINLGKWILRYICFGWLWDKKDKFMPEW